jgi:hypothetical protein
MMFNTPLPTSLRRMATWLIAACAAWLVFAQSAHADTITVTNNADSGPGSLRTVIASANSGDTIMFDPNVTGTIQLTGGELAITKSVTISGTSANTLAVSGNNSGRVFSITVGSNVTISDLTIRDGSVNGYGGGVYNAGNLTLVNTMVANNSADTDGGGIANQGALSLTNSTVAYNTSYFGSAGILNSGALSILNGTISDNITLYGPSGIGNFGVLTITYSTLLGEVYTIGGQVWFKGAILSDCTTTDGGATLSQGHNLDYGNTCGLGASGDLTNTNALVGPLANNGGPTLTHALLAGSPAINAGGADGCPGTDQRGSPRPQGRLCDIGAFEFTLKTFIFFPFTAKL